MRVTVPEFQLDARLISDSLPLLDLELCSLRLMNDCRFPWLLLVPRRADCVEILDLDEDDQHLLWAEIRQVATALREIVQPDKLNIAALGNVVVQLHVHVVARFRSDDAWPAPVWGVGQARPWDQGGRELILALQQALTKS